MNKKIPVLGIISLFVLSTFSSMAISFDSIKTQEDELKPLFDDIRFICTNQSGFNSIKYNYYKEQILIQYSSDNRNDDVVEQGRNELESQVEPSLYSIVSSGGPMDSPWPMHGHDVHHTGQSPYSTIDNPYDEKWRSEIDGCANTPAIADDGTIYVGGGINELSRYLIALNPDGAEKWRYKTNGLTIFSSPAIAEDGTIYIGSWDTGLYAINPDGTKKWRFGSGGVISSSPTIDDDGTIYCGHAEGDIFAMNPNGTRKWRYKTEGDVYSDPCIGDDGTIYCGSNDNYLYALNPDGTLKWKFKTGFPSSLPSIADDGTIYAAGAWSNNLFALYPNNGTIKWMCNIWCNSNPSIDSDGIIYVGGDEELYAVYPNGTVKWSFYLGNERWLAGIAPAISSDGTIYVGTNIGSGVEGGDIIAINSDGTLRWRKKISDQWIDSSPSIAKDGTVYIHSRNQGQDFFHAFGVAEFKADANGPYFGLTNQPLQLTGTSSGGYLPHSYHWEFGDTFTSEEQNPIHTYTSPGEYDVILTVTDNKSNNVFDTTYAWIQTTNSAPDKPTIDGPINGGVGVTYDYTFSAIDSDNSIVYLFVDWGDNSNTGWKGPYDSSQQVTFSHKWTTEDIFTIKAKAKDPYEAEGPWETLDITIPRNKAINNVLFWRLIGEYPLLERFLSITQTYR